MVIQDRIEKDFKQEIIDAFCSIKNKRVRKWFYDGLGWYAPLKETRKTFNLNENYSLTIFCNKIINYEYYKNNDCLILNGVKEMSSIFININKLFYIDYDIIMILRNDYKIDNYILDKRFIKKEDVDKIKLILTI